MITKFHGGPRPPSRAHTHTHTHAQAHAHTHAHTRTRALAHTRGGRRPRAHTHPRGGRRPRIHAYTHTHTHTRAHTGAHGRAGSPIAKKQGGGFEPTKRCTSLQSRHVCRGLTGGGKRWTSLQSDIFWQKTTTQMSRSLNKCSKRCTSLHLRQQTGANTPARCDMYVMVCHLPTKG